MTDELTPKERIDRFLTGKPIDRAPCVPLILNHAARVAGAKVGAYATDGAVMGAANVAAFRRYGQDMITIFTDTAIMAEAMGTRLYFPDDDVSRVEKPALEDGVDPSSLPPADPRTSGRLPVLLEAVRHCVEQLGSEVYTCCCIPAPFSTGAALRGTAAFAKDTYKNPALVRTIIEKATLFTEKFAQAVAEVGGIPGLVDPVASGSVIGRKAFEEFAMPGIKPLIDRIRSLGFPAILHICGRTSSIVDLMADTGAQVLSVDQIPLSEAVEKVGDRACLMGNVRPTETLLESTPEEVKAEALECLRAASGSPSGFILASGCEVPIETPGENIDALFEAAREYAGK
ncbi:MAG: uroporphyrinogen decarboxylase family protein [Planctomycetota bacterium]|jgi:uroporphyrinogen decarboxylase